MGPLIDSPIPMARGTDLSKDHFYRIYIADGGSGAGEEMVHILAHFAQLRTAVLARPPDASRQ